MAEPLSNQASLHCIVCGRDWAADQVQTGRVHANVRKFKDETFRLWQCPSCRTVHAADQVDLDYYYAHYPFHEQRMNAFTRLAYMGKLHQLEKLGLRREHRVLDYGSGGGVFVQLLRQEGFKEARGYDPYAKAGPDREPPGNGWDVVMSQDVIEHVEDPLAHLKTLKELAVPGALIFLGTPNGALIDLANADEYVHMLHQPYHRHILSAETIGKLAESIGMSLLQVKYGFYGNRLFPGLNGRFLRRILRTQGEVLDDMVAGVIPKSLALYTPAAVWDAVTGAFRDPGYDMTIALRCN